MCEQSTLDHFCAALLAKALNKSITFVIIRGR
jgi:hypothetical protein